jgi:hypothetical protein
MLTVAINGHGRYQTQEIRPYGHGTSNGYITDNRQMLTKINTGQREEYVAVPLMDHTGSVPRLWTLSKFCR